MRTILILLSASAALAQPTIGTITTPDIGTTFVRVVVPVTQNVTATGSQTIGSCSPCSFTVASGLTGLPTGKQVRLTGSAGNYIGGVVVSYSGTTVSINQCSSYSCALSSGSGTFSTWTLNMDPYAQLYYGTTNGTYPYSTWIYLTGQSYTLIPTDDGVFSMNIGGLNPGTTYYATVVAYPDPGAAPTTSTGSVSSTFSFTTASGTVPSFPTSPSLYQPAYPSTTGYTTVTMTNTGTGGTWVAAGSVSHAANTRCSGDPAWSVTANQTLQQVVNEVYYGAIIEFPQGATGNMATTGITMPEYSPNIDPCAASIDDPAHGWVIQQTHQINASDFPPYSSGNTTPFRTGTQWSSNLATMNANLPYGNSSGSYGEGMSLPGQGQHFTFQTQSTGLSYPIHHFWLSNLQLASQPYNIFTSTSTTTISGSGSVSWTVPSGLTIPASGMTVTAYAPAPSMTGTVTSYTCTSGACSLVVSITSTVGSGTLSGWTITGTNNIATDGGTQTIGTGTFTFSLVEAGMSFPAGSAVTVTSVPSSGLPASAYMSGPVTYSGTTLTMTVAASSGTGSYSSWSFYAAPYGAFIALGAGEAGGNSDQAHPPSYIVFDRLLFTPPLPSATVGGSQIYGVIGSNGKNVRFTGSSLVGLRRRSSGISSAGPLGLAYYSVDCSTGPLTFDNNEISAAGQGFYSESVGDGCPTNPESIQNVAVIRNAVYMPPAWLIAGYGSAAAGTGYGAWDGILSGNYRNPIEFKNGQYVSVLGNWIDGSFAGQNEGAAVELSDVLGFLGGTNTTGIHDIQVGYNYMTHVTNQFEIFGAGSQVCCGYGPQAQLQFNVSFHDNLVSNAGAPVYGWNLNRSISIFTSTDWLSYGTQNMQFYNNTFDLKNGDAGISGGGTGPYNYAYRGLSYTGGSYPLMAGFSYTGNLDFLSVGATGGNSGIQAGPNSPCPGGCATFPVVPATSGTDSTGLFNSVMASVGSGGVTANGKWKNNVHVGGYYSLGQEPWLDLSSSQNTTNITTTTNLPNQSSDSYPNPTCTSTTVGVCIGQRVAAAGISGYSTKNWRLTPNASNYGGAVGANINGLEAALGITTNISITPGPTSLLFSYTAPDGNACSADVWTGAGTPVRTTASGGSRSQTISVTGLSSATSYNYRLMCAYAQIGASGPDRPWFSFPSETSNMQTEGTVSTLSAAASRTLTWTGTLATGATQALLSYAPIAGGSATTQTCSGSSGAACTVAVSINSGAYLLTVTNKTSGGVQVSQSAVTPVTIF